MALLLAGLSSDGVLTPVDAREIATTAFATKHRPRLNHLRSAVIVHTGPDVSWGTLRTALAAGEMAYALESFNGQVGGGIDGVGEWIGWVDDNWPGSVAAS